MAQESSVLQLSRSSSVRLISQAAQSSGSGFFVADEFVLTCFHVVASIVVEDKSIKWSLHPDLQVVTPSGETIAANVVSIPAQTDASPLMQDFALVKLQAKPSKSYSILTLASEKEAPTVGDDVVFSGYPLATPGMATHRGMVSGYDESLSIIFVQAPVNKGNSGGALLNAQGHVIGIVSMREGGISQGLQQLQVYIDQTSSHGSVQLMGVDPLQATKAIIQTLDQYISTGIGYARSIKCFREYTVNNKVTLK
jgi:S1-C subfamily serine protease